MKNVPNPNACCDNIEKLPSVELKNGPSRSEKDRSLYGNQIVPLLTVEDVATRCQVKKKTVYNWIYKGLITPIKVGPRLVRFEPKEVERWISRKGDS